MGNRKGIENVWVTFPFAVESQTLLAAPFMAQLIVRINIPTGFAQDGKSERAIMADALDEAVKAVRETGKTSGELAHNHQVIGHWVCSVRKA